jgi:hypothetical protein
MSAEHSFDVTISFAAGGWFQMYHFGACKALIDSGYLADKRVRYCGSSAGSLAASSLAAGCNQYEAMKDFAAVCADHYRESFWNIFCVKEYLMASIHRFGDAMMTPGEEKATIDKLNGGKLEIYTTTLPFMGRRIISDFTSMDDVEEALLASCCLTPWVGFPFRLRKTGELVCDGGFRAFQPRKGEPQTITISPFYFTSADIRPSIFVPVWWGIYPPPRKHHLWLFNLGFNDTLEYLLRHGEVPSSASALLIKETHCEIRGSYAFGKDLLFTGFYLFILRPAGVVAIYAELLIMILALSMVSIIGKSRWKALFTVLRNLFSIRVFLRLFISNRIGMDEQRLASSSRVFRAFHPLVFESHRVTNTVERSMEKRSRKLKFAVAKFWNMKGESVSDRIS